MKTICFDTVEDAPKHLRRYLDGDLCFKFVLEGEHRRLQKRFSTLASNTKNLLATYGLFRI